MPTDMLARVTGSGSDAADDCADQVGNQWRQRPHGPGHPGDLYCTVVVETPVRLDKRQRELLEAFEATFADADKAKKHSPRSSGFVDNVKQFWARMTG